MGIYIPTCRKVIYANSFGTRSCFEDYSNLPLLQDPQSRGISILGKYYSCKKEI